VSLVEEVLGLIPVPCHTIHQKSQTGWPGIEPGPPQ